MHCCEVIHITHVTLRSQKLFPLYALSYTLSASKSVLHTKLLVLSELHIGCRILTLRSATVSL
jgi:hypothetical protein